MSASPRSGLRAIGIDLAIAAKNASAKLRLAKRWAADGRRVGYPDPMICSGGAEAGA